MLIPVHLRHDALEALGGILSVTLHIHGLYPQDAYSLKDNIRMWADGQEPPDEHLQMFLCNIFDQRFVLHDMAQGVGGVADKFDIVWPAYNARMKPQALSDETCKIAVDGWVIDHFYHGDMAIQGALALARHLAKHKPEEARRFLSRAPVLVDYLRSSGKNLVDTLSILKRNSEIRLKADTEKLDATAFLLSEIQETE